MIKMTKKLVIILSIFCFIILTSGVVFANNMVQDTQNALNGARSGAQNMMQDTGKAMEGAAQGVGNVMENAGKGMENMARGVGNTVEGAKNGLENMLHEGENGIENMGQDVKKEAEGTTTDDYTAIRTTAADAINATNRTNNITTWVILAVACAIVVLLVWYYGTQTNNKDNY